MFYETAQTVGPGWHRSYKPPHYEEMSWSPSHRPFRSPGTSPETYRRIIRTEEDFPDSNQDQNDEFFRTSRRSPTFSRRIFKDVWGDSASPRERFSERPRMFKRVFRPNNFEEEFDRDMPHLRRFEREFDRNFDDNRASASRKFDEDFQRRFNNKDMEDDFGNEGKVHHIPIMVERRMEDIKNRFGRKSSPPDQSREDEYADEWSGPQVQRLRKAFEQEDGFATRPRNPTGEASLKSRMYANVPETWDPQAIHTLPTRKNHKFSQSFDDCRHPPQSKNVSRSYSETHESVPKSQQPHSAAFRSHSDGHCPKQTYITKIEVNTPDKEPKENQSPDECAPNVSGKDGEQIFVKRQNSEHPEEDTKPKSRAKYDSPALQQITVVLQNVEDLVQRIDSYSGTGRDKQFRFLDEMLTRCMLRLDDIETEGREDVRNARKAAIREVQNCIDKLEAKADEAERNTAMKKENHQVKEAVASPTEMEPKVAIPLGDSPKMAIPLGDGPKMAIPLGDSSSTAIPLPDTSSAPIPLRDSSDVPIPLTGTVIPLRDAPKLAIPLGDVPRTSQNSDEVVTSHPVGGLFGRVEQTKL